MINSSTVFSECGRYRYKLERELGHGQTALVIMINPSWANAVYNDRTITKLIGFSERNGWGKLIVGNKFAYRSQYPKELASVDDPIGPENDTWLREMIKSADICIAAWGPISKIRNKNFRNRWKTIKNIVDEEQKSLLCWGTANDGHALHPLMLPYSSTLRTWIAPDS